MAAKYTLMKAFKHFPFFFFFLKNTEFTTVLDIIIPFIKTLHRFTHLSLNINQPEIKQIAHQS